MTWETFRDVAYFDMWCVRPVGERKFGRGFHLVNGDEARALAELLTASVDTHPKGGDGTAPALLSSAVGEAETPTPTPSQDQHKEAR